MVQHIKRFEPKVKVETFVDWEDARNLGIVLNVNGTIELVSYLSSPCVPRMIMFKVKACLVQIGLVRIDRPTMVRQDLLP